MADTLPTVDEAFGAAPLPTVDEAFPPDEEAARQYRRVNTGTAHASPVQDFLFSSNGPVGTVFHSAGRVLDAFGQGVNAAGPAESFSKETGDYIKKWSGFNEWNETSKNIGRAANNVLLRPAAYDLSLLAHGFGAMLSGPQAAVAQLGEEVGQPKLGREVAAIPEAFMGAPHPTGMPGRAIAELERARSLGVIGPDGEAGYLGTKVPKIEEPGTAAVPAALPGEPEALLEERAGETPALPATPDIHATVRQAEPKLFEEYDALTHRRDILRRFIDEREDTGKTPADMKRVADNLKEAEARLRELAPDVAEAYRAAEAPAPGSREELEAMVDRGASVEDLIKHPVVTAAAEANRRLAATGRPEELADPAWRAQRTYDFDGQKVQSTDNAVARLVDKAKSYSSDGPVEDGQHAIIVMGPPAAGKSTISNPIATRYRAAVVDADDAKLVIPEYRKGLGTMAVHEESSVMAKEMLTALINEGSNIVLPKVGDNIDSIRRTAAALREKGYTVDLVHAGATPEISARRNIARFLKTGRLVPPEYISEVGDKPRQNYHILKGEGFNETADFDTSTQPARAIDGADSAVGAAVGAGDGRGAGPASAGRDQGGEAAPAQAAVQAQVAPQVAVPSDSIAAQETRKLIAAGRPKAEAAAAAQVIKAYWETRAARFKGAKGTAQEMYAREAPDIVGPEARQPSALISPKTIARAEQALRKAEAVEPTAAAPATPADATIPPADRAAPLPGLPNAVQMFSPADLAVDAKRFQFKDGGDEAGVTDRLKGVTQWDPVKAGMVLVWQDSSGKNFIVDGHQRHALATRIANDDPVQNPQLLARVVREADGVTDVAARVMAAAKNIAEGTGTAVDAAKVLRDRPDLIKELPPRSELVRQARGLTNLSDDAFRMVVNDVVPPQYAAIVGRLAPQDAELQSALLGLLAKTEPANAMQAEAIVRQGIEAGTAREAKSAQGGLFGDDDVATSLYVDRAKVLDKALKEIVRDKKVFSVLSHDQETIEAAGNKLATDINSKRAAADAQALQVLQTLANRKGPVSDALGDAAKRARADGRSTGAVRDFVAAIRGLVETGDLARLADGIERGPAHVGAEDASRVVERAPERGSVAEEAKAAKEVREVEDKALEFFQGEKTAPTEGAIYESLGAKPVKRIETTDDLGAHVLSPDGKLYDLDGIKRSENENFHDAFRAQLEEKGATDLPFEITTHGESISASGPSLSRAQLLGLKRIAKEIGTERLLWRREGGKIEVIGVALDDADVYRDVGFKEISSAPVELFQRGRGAPAPGQGDLFGQLEAATGRVEANPRDQAARQELRWLIDSTKAGPQNVLPGFERSAVQAAASREAAGGLRGTKPQEAPGDLFGDHATVERELFQGSAKGKIRLRGGGRSTITLFRDADASTFIHETGHDWLDRLMRDAEDAQAPGDLKADAATVLRWLGVDKAADIKTRHHEKFARGFETYMMEGRAPSQALASVFAKFKAWLTRIYQTVQRLKAPINDDIRAVFDRFLTTESQRVVEAPERESASFADIHEADAAHPEPDNPHALAETIQAERDRVAANDSREDIDSRLANTPDQARRSEAGGAQPGGDGDAAGPLGREPRAPAQPGALGAGGGEAAGEGAGAGAARPAAPEVKTEAPSSPSEPFEKTSPLIDKAGNIRLDTLNQPEDVNRVLRDMADRNNQFMPERRGVISDKTALNLADALGMDPAKLNMRRLGQTFNEEELIAAAKLLIQAGTETRDAMAKAAEGNEADVLAYAEARQRLLMIQGQFSGATAEAGRALRAFQVIAKMTGMQEAKEMASLIRDQTGKTLFQLQREAREGAKLDTAAKVNGFVRDSEKPSFGDMFLEYWMTRLISGLATHSTYLVGNELLALWRAGPETAAAAVSGSIFRAFGGQRGVYMGEVPAQLYGMMKGFPDAVVATWESLKTGKTTPLPGELASMSPRELAMSPLVNPRQAIPDFTIGGVPVPLGTLVRLSARPVAMVHSFSRFTNFAREKAAIAYRTAANEGLDGHKLRARIADVYDHPSDEVMQQSRESATELTLMGKGGNLTRAMNNLVNTEFYGVRWLKFVAPFVHISSNVIEQAILQRTPVGLIDPEIRANLSGANGPVARDMAIGRMVVGSGLGIAVGSLAAQGLVNGSGPSDPKERAIATAVNGPPHSIRVGNMWYDIHRLGPIGMQFSIAADLYEVAHIINEEDGAKVVAALSHAFTQNILDESFMRGPAEIMRALTDSERYGAGWVRQFVSSWSPLGVFGSQMARATDPWSRSARTTLDAVKANTPWLSETLLPRRDVFGEPVPNKDALGLAGLSAIYESRVNNDPVPKAMLDAGYFPAMPLRKIRNVELTDQQYDDYARIAGRMAKMRLDAIVRNPGFAQLPPGPRHEMMQRAVTQSRQDAEAMVLMQNPKIIKDAADAKVAKLKGEKVH